MRVFVVEYPQVLSISQKLYIWKEWKNDIQETELEDSRLLIFDGGAKIKELTGDGVEKLTIEDGRITFPEKQP